MNNSVENSENQNSSHFKINIISVALFFLKFILVIIVVFSALYILNARMADFIAEERAVEREREAEIRAKEREREDNERINENYRINDQIIDQVTDNYDGHFFEIFDKRVNADYIFIGTSHFTHGVTPEAFEDSGKRFFNFALNGSNPSYYVWWYNEVFKPSGYVKPKAIIFGVNWFMFDTNWLWRRPEFDYRYLRDYSNPPPDVDEEDWDYESAVVEATRYTGKWYDIDSIISHITNTYPFFISRSRFIDLVLPEKKEESKEIENISEEIEFTVYERKIREPILTYEGNRLDHFYMGYIPWEADFNGHHAGTAGTHPFQEEKDAFIRLLDQFQADGIPVVFVMAPEYLPGRTAPQFDELTDEITAVATAKGIPFLNYNRELASDINSDHTYYSDWGHLNNRGAQRFSRKLYEDLKPILQY